MSQLGDIALIARVTLYNDTEAFSRLVIKHQSALRRLFLNLTNGNKALSDDLAQETFIKAYTHIGQFKLQAKFTTWLFSIAYNLFYDYKRSQKKEVSIDSSDALELKTNSSRTSTLDLHDALKILNDNEKICITLFYMEDLRIQDIEKITQLPKGTIKSSLSRGRIKLADYLKKNGYENYK